MFGPKLPPTLPPPSRHTGQSMKRKLSYGQAPRTRVSHQMTALMLSTGSSTPSVCFPPPEKAPRKKSKEKRHKNKKQHKHKKEKV